MSSIIFYNMPESPFSRAVEIVLNLLKLDRTNKKIDLFKNEQNSEEFLKINPRHQVPFIIDGNLCLSESRAINTYLVNKYAKDDSLYPKDAAKRAQVDELLYFDAGTLVPAGMALLRPKIFGGEIVKENEAKYREALKYIDARVKGHSYLLSDNYTLADISIVSSLTLPLHVVEYDISEFGNLVKYCEHVTKSVPFFEEITKPAVEKLKAFAKANKK